MQILVNYNHSDACFEIEATGSEVPKMVETIYANWERNDPGCDKPEFEVCKFGKKPLYFDTDGPCYVIFEF